MKPAAVLKYLRLLAALPLLFGARSLQTPASPLVTYKAWELVTALSWSPDGQWLAVAAGNSIRLVRVAGGSEASSLATGALTHALAFSPDGARLAAASHDGSVRVWLIAALRAGEREPAWQALAHKKGAGSLAWTPDSLRLATGGNDAIARVWDAASGELLSEIIGGTFAVPALAFSPDGAALAVANGNLVRLRDPAARTILGTLQAENPLFGLAFSPDGSRLAAADTENGVLVWDTAQAQRRPEEGYPTPVALEGHQGQGPGYTRLVWRLAYSPDGKWLASAGGDGTLRLWEAGTGLLAQTYFGHQAAVTSLAFSPDSKRLASGGLDAAIYLWDLP